MSVQRSVQFDKGEGCLALTLEVNMQPHGVEANEEDPGPTVIFSYRDGDVYNACGPDVTNDS